MPIAQDPPRGRLLPPHLDEGVGHSQGGGDLGALAGPEGFHLRKPRQRDSNLTNLRQCPAEQGGRLFARLLDQKGFICGRHNKRGSNVTAMPSRTRRLALAGPEELASSAQHSRAEEQGAWQPAGVTSTRGMRSCICIQFERLRCTWRQWRATPGTACQASNPSAGQAADGPGFPLPTLKGTHLHVAILRGGQGSWSAG